MKIYIVSARYCTELEPAMAFKEKKEAESCAHNYIYAGARQEYERENYESDNPTDKELDEWADNNDYVLHDYYFWDGNDEVFEANITETEVV